MKIKIFKDNTGPYPNKLHDYNYYMQRIINEIEKIKKENIIKLNIYYENRTINTNNIEIRPNSITIKEIKENKVITKIIDINKIFEIEIISK